MVNISKLNKNGTIAMLLKSVNKFQKIIIYKVKKLKKYELLTRRSFTIKIIRNKIGLVFKNYSIIWISYTRTNDSMCRGVRIKKEIK